jgi:hypothetical protein
MTGWNTAKPRYRLVHHAAADVAQSGQRGLTQWQPAIEAEYGNLDNFLRTSRRATSPPCWHGWTRSSRQTRATRRPTAAVFAEAARVHPDLWQVLQDYAGQPALAEGSAHFRAVLAGTGIDPAALMPGGSARDVTGPADSGKPAFPSAVRPIWPGVH